MWANPGCPLAPMQIPHKVWPDHGPALMGPMHDLTGLAHLQANPTVPTVAHANPTQDWTGLAIWGIFQKKCKTSSMIFSGAQGQGHMTLGQEENDPGN